MNLKPEDAVCLIRWKLGNENERIIIYKSNAIFAGILDNKKYSFHGISPGPKNCCIELYGLRWCLIPCENSYDK